MQVKDVILSIKWYNFNIAFSLNRGVFKMNSYDKIEEKLNELKYYN